MSDDNERFASMSEVIREIFPYALRDERPAPPSPWDDQEHEADD